ncbi:MAG TPA: TrmJ/YjtD family RNA methyltransferase [Euryarchaeota archaeon]|nr:TrmJ/YjtD family RNA methyltransferase [Euryarchaeota archaeon]
MAEICVVLVEPKHECNVGFVARAMKNFGLGRLYFSGRDFKADFKAFECAAHAGDVLRKSVHLGDSDLNQVFDITVGTTAKTHDKPSSPRHAITPRELATRLSDVTGTVGLLLGREDSGLSNSELDCCDMVVSIPTPAPYSTMNLSHAAAVLFYELSQDRETNAENETQQAEGCEKEALHKRFNDLLEAVDQPNYKRDVSERIFRRVIGRAGISGREAHTLAGVFKKANETIKKGKNNG